MHTVGLARLSPTIRGSLPAIHTTISVLQEMGFFQVLQIWKSCPFDVSITGWSPPWHSLTRPVPRQPLSPSLGSPVPFPNRPSASPTKGLNGHRRDKPGETSRSLLLQTGEIYLVSLFPFCYLCHVTWNGKPPSPFRALPALTFNLHWFSSDTLSPRDLQEERNRLEISE